MRLVNMSNFANGQTITVGGEVQQGYGTACRQPDGTWKIQS